MTTSYQQYIDAEKLPVSFKVLIPKSGFLMPINQYGPIVKPTYITREQYKKLIAYGIPVEVVKDEPVVVEVKKVIVDEPKIVDIVVDVKKEEPVVVEPIAEQSVVGEVKEEPEVTPEVVEPVVTVEQYTNDSLNAKQTSELLAILRNEYGIESEAKVPKRADIIKRILKLQESK